MNTRARSRIRWTDRVKIKMHMELPFQEQIEEESDTRPHAGHDLK